MTVRVDEYKERLCEEHNNPPPEPFKWWDILLPPRFDCPPMPWFPSFITIDAMTDGDLYGSPDPVRRRPMVEGDLYPVTCAVCARIAREKHRLDRPFRPCYYSSL